MSVSESVSVKAKEKERKLPLVTYNVINYARLHQFFLDSTDADFYKINFLTKNVSRRSFFFSKLCLKPDFKNLAM